MAKQNQRSTLANKHLNRGLFSDYYLNEIVPTSNEFRSDTLFASVKIIRDALLERLDTLVPEELDEAQLEDRWIKPVMETLGHHWSVQVKIRYRDRGFRKPDYAFADTAESAQELRNEIYTPDMLQNVIAIGDAKKWGTKLDQSSGREDRNPSQQIDEYLRYSEVRWGILTDGRYWRLYERSTSKDNTFYAVDLEALLRYGEVDDFYYFYLFFCRESFAKAGWLEQILSGSVDYAENLSDQLEDEVFNALELIAQGFLNFRRNNLKADDPETLRVIYEESLVFLYRLLFIFYAESRDILPMLDNQAYAEGQSLSAIKKEVAPMIDYNPSRLARMVDDDTIYARLTTLFFNIDEGSKEYNITAYNGRLFSENEHPFLANKRVGNAYLSYAIDRLARVPDKNDNNGRKRVYVDYRDLDVRHLGAIYERLLEYQLDVATESLTVKSRNNREVYEVASYGDKIVKNQGDILLRTGSNERKVTGSYYTPDYIVTFIVENTLEPLLTNITTQYADLDDAGHWNVRDSQGLGDAILSLNVLDPATGSGHFMVEVVNYMAKWLTILNLLPSDIERDEEELTYWKRQVVAACVYGIDVNPLAVELARLSLWLATISRDRPLSFLNHHVRLGNTLVGARLDQLTPTDNFDINDQLPLWDVSAFSDTVRDAVGRMMTIEHTIAETVTDVKAQEKSFAAIFDVLEPWHKLAHVWTARHFGLDMNTDQWQALYETITTGAILSPELQILVDEALQLHENYHFFHWELAFPEVFFAEDGNLIPNGGFDAIVGNPPYVRMEKIKSIKPFLSEHYQVYESRADLFLYFYERALDLLRPENRFGFITSGTFMSSNSATPFRQFVHERAGLEWVANFGENQPFKGAEMVFPTIFIARAGQPHETFKHYFMEGNVHYHELEHVFRQAHWENTYSQITRMDEWRFQSKELTELFKKIDATPMRLGKFINETMFYGVKTGFNEAFILSEEQRNEIIKRDASSKDIIKPMLSGRDLRPWYKIDSKQYLIFAMHGIEIEKYPAIFDHLLQYKSALSRRATINSHEWYELQQPQMGIYSKFVQPKICWAEISKLPRFSIDIDGYYPNNSCYFAVSEDYSLQTLLALMQSRISWFYISQVAIPLRLRAGLWQYKQFQSVIERLPIPELNSTKEQQLAEYAKQLTRLAQERYQLHEAFRHRVKTDIGAGAKLNTKLTEWYDLPDFSAFRNEIVKSFGPSNDIPLRERSDWDIYLQDELTKHNDFTGQIITLETQLNAVVYKAFNLESSEISLIEEVTKYPYGAV